MSTDYDDLIARMTRMVRPVAHANTETCQSDALSETGHSLQCESLTGSIAAMLVEMYLEGHRCGAEVGCMFHFHDRFHDYNRYY